MNILVVDDIIVIRKMVCKVAQSLDANVFEAGNGEEAISVLNETGGKIDLIFLDWNMPKMTGIEFLTHIKKSPKYKDIPVVMTTTVNERENIIKAIQAGAAQYLVKPFTQEDILNKILERIDVSASLRYLFLLNTRELLATITKSEVEEKDSSGLSEDDGCELYSQVLVSGQQKIMLIYSATKESVSNLIGLKTGKKGQDLENKNLLLEFNKFMGEVAKQCLSQTQGQGYAVTYLYSSFINEKMPVFSDKNISIVAKLFSTQDVKITLTTFFV